MAAPPILVQTTYAELLERCAAAAFQSDFPDDGAFVAKTIEGRRYWYFQQSGTSGRSQKYVGPETDDLLGRIERHKHARDDERERRSMVSTLVRSFGMARAIPEIGNVIAALAKAGTFRLRGVLVGTAAYQTYAAMLGTRFPGPLLQTADVDIAQFKNVSVAVEDRTPPTLDVLRAVDRTFRPVPHHADSRKVASYVAKGGLRVDFLTPNRGADTEKPQALRALQTDALPLRFLDYLIFEPEPAVVLHGAGIYILVPAPERFAVHKLIVSRRRRTGDVKRDKDVRQSEALLPVLLEKRPQALQAAWQEAHANGRRWSRLLFEGMRELTPAVRDTVLKLVAQTRAALPGIDLVFENPPAHYDFRRDIVTFAGNALDHPVQCAISREALDDHFGGDVFRGGAKIEAFLANRSTIERLARIKYLTGPVEEPGSVLIKTEEVARLRKVRVRVA
jgi:hypothetical protein